jgi:ribonuclease T1
VRSRVGLTGGLLAAALLVVAALVIFLRPPGTDPATPETLDAESGLPVVALVTLPVEVRDTVALIDRGGPFPYAKDGAVFGNREQLLPNRPVGFYREYTVPTPGESDRGPRRIVTGDGMLFYTADHYASFVRVAR